MSLFLPLLMFLLLFLIFLMLLLFQMLLVYWHCCTLYFIVVTVFNFVVFSNISDERHRQPSRAVRRAQGQEGRRLASRRLRRGSQTTTTGLSFIFSGFICISSSSIELGSGFIKSGLKLMELGSSFIHIGFGLS